MDTVLEYLRLLQKHPQPLIPILILTFDLLIGDPQSWSWHPVRLLGRFAGWLEFICRNRFPSNPFHAGMTAAFLMISTTTLFCYYLGNLLDYLLPEKAYTLVCAFLCYFCIAVHDMIRHSRAVMTPLKKGDLPQARQRLSWIVGRDTNDLNEREIARATVESVAESYSDGVLAPLFYICIGLYFGGETGALIGGFIYRSVNTLDSMFGHKNERYIEFGFCSAKLDDLFNFIPARLSAVIIAFAALLSRNHPLLSAATAIRQGKLHASPNSGYPEAAFAGALGLQLGGDNYYKGLVRTSPKIGQPIHPLTANSIHHANRLFLAASATAVILCALILWLLS